MCELLNKESSSVKFLGVWGMGGLGKSTAVSVLYHRLLSEQFDAHYFVESIRHESKYQLVTIRNKIISKVLGEEFTERTPSIGCRVIRRLNKKKVLIVLDDVSTVSQITTLVETKTNCWFAPGSKVIITSRDSGVLKSEDITVFEIKKMSPECSLKLFCLNAFKQNQPLKDYEKLSQQIVHYAQGVPLALKVLGSFLYEREMEEWVSTLGKLKGSLNVEIEEVLKISYDDLDREEKIIFLDITCFFKGDDKDRVKDILNGCGFPATIGIKRLFERCLITLSKDNKLGMHDLLQLMGWKIARLEVTPEFGVRSRFWTPEDSYNVLTSFLETNATEGIVLDMDNIEKLNINSTTFTRMQKLRLLKFECSGSRYGESKIRSDIQFLPNSLRLLHWIQYPWEYLPSSFSAENIVELRLHSSKLKQLWDEIEYPLKLNKLKVLDLRGSRCLTTLPNLASATNLEEIILDYCEGLVEIPVSIQHLQSLSYLSLKHCVGLCSIPRLVNLKKLKTLNLYGCSSLKEFPEVSGDIEVLKLSNTNVTHWPPSMSSFNNLKVFSVPSEIISLPSTIHLNSLKTLGFQFCGKLQEFPKIIGPSIQSLDLSCSGIRELPSSIFLLDSLVNLYLSSCRDLERLPTNFGQLKRLEKLNLHDCKKLFERPFTLQGLTSIIELDLSSCNLREIPAWLSTLTSLQVLHLEWNWFESVPKNLLEIPSQVNNLNLPLCESLEVGSSSIIVEGGQRQQRASNFNLPGYQFNFLGCLSEGAHKNIVTSALARIQCMANSRIENGKLPFRVSLHGIGFLVRFLPKIFHQSPGSSITVELPVNWCTTMFMGFTVGVIACSSAELLRNNARSGWDLPSEGIVSYRCYFKKDDCLLGSHSASLGHVSIPISENIMVLQYSGDIYSPRKGSQFCRENHKDATHVVFDFNTDSDMWVEKCGVYLVYAEVEDQINSSIVQNISVTNEAKMH